MFVLVLLAPFALLFGLIFAVAEATATKQWGLILAYLFWVGLFGGLIYLNLSSKL